MADRVKYFMLGLLFLVVAGVIAYDRWNSREAVPDEEIANYEKENGGKILIGPEIRNASKTPEPRDPEPLIIPNFVPEPKPEPVLPEPKPEPVRPKPPAKERFHVVRSGEALEKISRQYYEAADVYKGIDLIVKANGLRNANVISEGQKLVIPAMDARTSPRPVVIDRDTPAKEPAPAGNTTEGVPSEYVVKASDGDLYKICRKFYGRDGEGARIARIMKANNLWSVNVKAGTKLTLPPK